MGHFAGDEVGGTLAVTGVLGTHVLGNGGERGNKGFVVRVLLADLRVACKAGSHDQKGIVGGGVQIHAHLVVGAGHHGLEGLFQQDGRDRRIGGVEGQHGSHVGGDHAAALANGTHRAGLAAQLELDGVFLLWVSVVMMAVAASVLPCSSAASFAAAAGMPRAKGSMTMG